MKPTNTKIESRHLYVQFLRGNLLQANAGCIAQAALEINSLSACVSFLRVHFISECNVCDIDIKGSKFFYVPIKKTVVFFIGLASFIC